MSKFTDHTGETNTAKNGLKMTIIAYRKHNDVDIQFEDGTNVYNKTYINFKKGEIKHPYINTLCNKNKIKYIGETNIAKNGLKMEIIEYYNNRNITIRFEDGTIVYNKQYGNFKTGIIKHPNINIQSTKSAMNHIGETNIANNGMEMEIIEYYNKNNITIKFKDGTIVYNKRYNAFKKGIIKNPNINAVIEKGKNRIGETNIANNGLKMTIIEYHTASDITIKFEDGTIVYNKNYCEFKEGTIKHPNINTITEKNKNRIGETNIANNGLKMTIIEYYTASNITVKFEDGTVVYNKSYEQFRHGGIGHPTIKTKHKIKINRINETRIMKCGLKATIINYRGVNDIDVQLENNIIIYNKQYDGFKKGTIRMPNIINNIRLKEFAYKLNNDWYYICSHPTWTEDKILSIKEIYAYQSKQVA